MLSPHWLVKGGVSNDFSNFNPWPVRAPLSQFETRYKMVLILTLGLILLVLRRPGKLHADEHNKAQLQYMTGLKLLKDQSQNAATNHTEANT